MERTQTTWLSTKDIAKRWGCTPLTVGRRLRALGVTMTTLGVTNYLPEDRLLEAEERMGITGMFG